VAHRILLSLLDVADCGWRRSLNAGVVGGGVTVEMKTSFLQQPGWWKSALSSRAVAVPPLDDHGLLRREAKG